MTLLWQHTEMQILYQYLISLLLSFTLAIDLFQYGAEFSDTVLIDMASNIILVDPDDGVKLINTANFPFFDLKENKQIQVRAIFVACLYR